MYQPIRAVAFDLDGTMYSLSRLRRRFVLRHPWLALVVLAMGQVREELRREGVERPDLQAELDRRLAARLHCSVARATRLQEQVVRRVWPATVQRVGPYPGLRSLLDELAAAAIPLGVFSDYPTAEKLMALGLADLPWVVQLDGCSLGALKPLPRPFHLLAERLSVPPAEVLYVGDRGDTDGLGATAAGLQAAVLVPAGNPTPALPPGVLRFADYAELTRLIRPRLVAGSRELAQAGPAPAPVQKGEA